MQKLLIRTGLARRFPSLRRGWPETEGALHHWTDRLRAAPLDQVQALSERFDLGDEPERIDLSLGEPRFDPLPSASTRLPADRRGSPDARGLAELREAVGA